MTLSAVIVIKTILKNKTKQTKKLIIIIIEIIIIIK